jgi:hypothetical protein
MSLAPEDVENSSLDDLNDEERSTLDEWHTKFVGKYRKVGVLKSN